MCAEVVDDSSDECKLTFASFSAAAERSHETYFPSLAQVQKYATKRSDGPSIEQVVAPEGVKEEGQHAVLARTKIESSPSSRAARDSCQSADMSAPSAKRAKRERSTLKSEDRSNRGLVVQQTKVEKGSGTRAQGSKCKLEWLVASSEKEVAAARAERHDPVTKAELGCTHGFAEVDKLVLKREKGNAKQPQRASDHCAVPLLADAGSSGMVALFERLGVHSSIAQKLHNIAIRRHIGSKQIKSLTWNLRRNSDLLARLNSEELKPADVFRMSHEELASPGLKGQREAQKQEQMARTVTQDFSSFPVCCEQCGSEEARGEMVNLSSGALDNDDSWGQMVLRASCEQCGHAWVEGKD